MAAAGQIEGTALARFSRLDRSYHVAPADSDLIAYSKAYASVEPSGVADRLTESWAILATAGSTRTESGHEIGFKTNLATLNPGTSGPFSKAGMDLDLPADSPCFRELRDRQERARPDHDLGARSA